MSDKQITGLRWDGESDHEPRKDQYWVTKCGSVEGPCTKTGGLLGPRRCFDVSSGGDFDRTLRDHHARLTKLERREPGEGAVVTKTQIHYPCGCVTCVCEDPERCHGCGSRTCKDRATCKFRPVVEVDATPDPRAAVARKEADAIHRIIYTAAKHAHNADEWETAPGPDSTDSKFESVFDWIDKKIDALLAYSQEFPQ